MFTLKKTQLKQIQRDYFPDRSFRKIIVESVKVEIDSNGLRITPSLVQERLKIFARFLAGIKNAFKSHKKSF